MNCTSARELIYEQLDGILSPDGARLLEEHLSACPECRRERELLGAIDGVLAAHRVERAPAWFDEAVATGIVEHVVKRRRLETIGVVSSCVVGSAATAYGLSRLVNWDGVTSAVRGLLEPLEGTSEFASTLVSGPALAGVALAFGAAALAFISISTLRYVRQFSYR